MRTGPRTGFRWTPETIVYAITLWYRKHSRTPFTSEWDQAGENHPSRQTVARVFGSWNAAMEAAGFAAAPARPPAARVRGGSVCRVAASRVVLLPGDGIGPEVAAEARLVLELLAPDVELDERLIGAAAIRATGTPLPDETLDACLAADAVLKGPVGDPEFDARRRAAGAGPARRCAPRSTRTRTCGRRSLDGVDVLIVRELVGGLYFGASGVREDGTAFDTCEYTPRQVERIVRRAFRLAQTRRGHLTSVDKANVLETSRLWRRDRRRGRRRVSGRPRRAHARRQRGDAARDGRRSSSTSSSPRTCSATSSPTSRRR